MFITLPAGIVAGIPLSHIDFARPAPAPTAVPYAAPLPTSPPDKGPNITQATSTAAVQIAMSLSYSVEDSAFVPPFINPVPSSV